MGSISVNASGVSVYSTRGGTTAYTLRVTRPPRSMRRKVCVSIFWEIPSMDCINSEGRLLPSPRSWMTGVVHLFARIAQTRRVALFPLRTKLWGRKGLCSNRLVRR